MRELESDDKNRMATRKSSSYLFTLKITPSSVAFESSSSFVDQNMVWLPYTVSSLSSQMISRFRSFYQLKKHMGWSIHSVIVIQYSPRTILYTYISMDTIICKLLKYIVMSWLLKKHVKYKTNLWYNVNIWNEKRMDNNAYNDDYISWDCYSELEKGNKKPYNLWFSRLYGSVYQLRMEGLEPSHPRER